jgi:hypothetical protein
MPSQLILIIGVCLEKELEAQKKAFYRCKFMIMILKSCSKYRKSLFLRVLFLWIAKDVLFKMMLITAKILAGSKLEHFPSKNQWILIKSWKKYTILLKKDLDNRKERNSVIVSPQNILNIYAPDRYSFHKIYNSSGA